MGWKENTSLGKTGSDGIGEPVTLAFRQPADLFVRRYKMLSPMTWPNSEPGSTAFDDSTAILRMATAMATAILARASVP